MRRTSSPLPRDEVHLWFARLPRKTLDGSIARLLDREERERAARYRDDTCRRRFIAGRVILRLIVAGYTGNDPDLVQLEYGWNGKPRLARGDLEFNLSHSASGLVFALASGQNIGVDIEEFRNRPDVVGFAARFFSPSERSMILQAPPARRSTLFFRIWTAKEAWLKARGLGLSGGLDSFSVLPTEGDDGLELRDSGGGRWWIQHVDLHPRMSCAFAVQAARPSLVVRRWSWNARRDGMLHRVAPP